MSETSSESLVKRALRSASLLTIGVALVLELLAHTSLYIPDPGVVLILAVVFAAFRDGVAAGLFSSAIAVAAESMAMPTRWIPSGENPNVSNHATN